VANDEAVLEAARALRGHLEELLGAGPGTSHWPMFSAPAGLADALGS